MAANTETTVHLTPEEFDLPTLLREACAFECDDLDAIPHGIKRAASPDTENANTPARHASPPLHDQERHDTMGPNPIEGPGGNDIPPKKQSRNNKRRKQKRNEAKAEEGRPMRQSVGQTHTAGKEPLLEVNIRYVDLPVTSCGFHGKREGKKADNSEGGVEDDPEPEQVTVEWLIRNGKIEIEWDGITPQVIVDRASSKILVVLVGRPKDEEYIKSVLKAAEAIVKAGEAAEFTPEELEHKRASGSAALNVGIYYGGGATSPGNFRNNDRHAKILEELVHDPDITRMAAFADSAFKLWSPRVYASIDAELRKLYEHDTKLVKNWDANVYPCAAFNFGPRVCCKTHRDFSNAPHTLCAIQALGRFNPKTGGHLYIRELGIYIQFPAGSTILIPSALLSHGNTPVGEGEFRVSFTQFCPGGLLRFVANEFHTEEWLRRRKKALWKEKVKEKETRWEDELALICTLEELIDMYKPEAEQK